MPDIKDLNVARNKWPLFIIGLPGRNSIRFVKLMVMIPGLALPIAFVALCDFLKKNATTNRKMRHGDFVYFNTGRHFEF